jgi:TQXA domain-containing protein
MIKKFLIGMMVLIILINTCVPCSYALEISSADLVKIGTADYHLKYNGRYIICSIVGYNKNGKFYPAYCMNSDLPGAETVSYTVNISELINNDAIWRVVTNGYPYVSAEEMGLDFYDAYEVTKLAIYCMLGQSDITKYSYDANDEIAHKMYDCLVNLVNIGYNRTDLTRQTGTTSINKSGGLVESGNNYYQEYTVNSKVNMEKYEISGISGFPERYKSYKCTK